MMVQGCWLPSEERLKRPCERYKDAFPAGEQVSASRTDSHMIHRFEFRGKSKQALNQSRVLESHTVPGFSTVATEVLSVGSGHHGSVDKSSEGLSSIPTCSSSQLRVM